MRQGCIRPRSRAHELNRLLPQGRQFPRSRKAYFRVDLICPFLLASGRVSWANLSRMLGKGEENEDGLKGFILTMGTCIAVLSAPGCATRAKRDPDQSLVRYQLAVGYFQNHRVEAAIEELDKALAADPENPEAYNLLGLVALKQAYDYEEQATAFSCLKGADEQSLRAEENRKLMEADGHFRRAVELRPDYPEAWNNRSTVALLLQSWDLAIETANNALKDPTYNSPMFARANLGWAYFHKKRLQDAWRELYDAVSRSPGFCVGRYRLAKVYIERGEIDEALTTIAPLVADVKRCPIQEAFLLAGMLHERRKDLAKARDYFHTCSEISPRSCVADECKRYAQMIQ
jgi:type IV pilus assembly protein PilF